MAMIRTVVSKMDTAYALTKQLTENAAGLDRMKESARTSRASILAMAGVVPKQAATDDGDARA